MEVKFKSGDSVAIPEGCKAVVKDDVVVFESTERKFKRGDFVYGEYSKCGQKFVFIFDREKYSNSSFHKCVLFLVDNVLFGSGNIEYDSVRPATDTEKQQLIDKLRENGKDWDEEKCKIVEYRWRAEIGEEYFYATDKLVGSHTEYNDNTDDGLYSSGNYFKTKELAAVALEKRNELFLTLKHS